MNYKTTSQLLIIIVLLISLEVLIIPASAAEIRRLDQGGLVAVGEVADISSVFGWAEKMAYYGISGDLESDPTYVLDLPDTKKGYYQFYLDPKIFSQRLGPWYQFYGNNTGTEHGNLLAFRVVKELPTITNLTNVTPTPVPTITPVAQIVPVKKFDTDYQIAYGDPFSVTVNEKYMPARLWVFGRIDAFYNRSYPTSKILVTSEDMQKLETGTYTVLVQNPGKNAIFEAGYAKTVTDVKTTEELVSPWAAVDPINIYGSQPRLVLTEFRKMIAGTDDPLTEYRLEVAHPVIDMVSVDETYSEGKDVLDIRGYTNVAKGTEITFVMDKERQIPQTLRANTHLELVREEAPNQWRYFQIFIPIDYNNTIVGQHQITASTPQGATQTIPFYVYDLPEGQEVPNQTIKYVSGNQFIPPVIVTVTIPIPGPTQIVTVKVTPPNEQVYAQQKLAEDKKWEEKKAEYISWAMTACGGLFLIGITWYGSSVVKRARRKE